MKHDIRPPDPRVHTHVYEWGMDELKALLLRDIERYDPVPPGEAQVAVVTRANRHEGVRIVILENVDELPH